MKRTKMIVAGHICLDMTPAFACGPCSRLDEILAPGKLIDVGAIDLHTGGSVANAGLAMKFFGADTVFMGKVGDDSFGKIVLDLMHSYGADQGMIVDPDSSTSYSIVLNVPGIDRMFLHNAGANDTFCEKDIDYRICDEALLFHFAYPTILGRMYADEGRELTGIFKKVREHGSMTSMDMSMIDENSAAAAADWEGILQRTLPYVDFFLPSIEEMIFMLDRDLYRRLQERAAGRDVTEVLDLKEDVAPVAHRLLDMGCPVVVLKCGAAGLYYLTAGEEAFRDVSDRSGLDMRSFADREGFERSYVPDRVVSGTGAGDTAIAAFLTAVTKGYPFPRCMQLAAAAGACCVEATDALSGLRSLEEMEHKIDSGWRKN